MPRLERSRWEQYNHHSQLFGGECTLSIEHSGQQLGFVMDPYLSKHSHIYIFIESDMNLAREFIEDGVVDFARQNPGIVVYVAPEKCSIPKIVAEYLNGTVKEEPVNRKTSEEIRQLIKKLSDQSGLEVIRIRKPFHTDSPSIQGQWHPFVNRSPSLRVQRFVKEKRELESSSS
ncbi:RM43 protein, partial [Polypterus senegalus]